MDIPHLSIVPYKEGATIVQIQIQLHAPAHKLLEIHYYYNKTRNTKQGSNPGKHAQ